MSQKNILLVECEGDRGFFEVLCCALGVSLEIWVATPKDWSSKAEVATWLAWQKKPGQGLYAACDDNLLNTQAQLYVELLAWLNLVFKS